MTGGDTTRIAVEDSADGYYTVALSFVKHSIMFFSWFYSSDKYKSQNCH